MTLAYKVKPQTDVQLQDYPTRYEGKLSRKEGETQFAELVAELVELQTLLYAAGTHSLLVVLQGMDTSGKDGTIRRVFGTVNPQGCRVESFKRPTEQELDHDFLWRIHRVTPGRGMIGIFNRSHYEDVLIVRVHNLVPKSVWKERYALINHFEEMLVAHQTIMVKIFLHISKDEQQERLFEREQDTTKAWKLSVDDWHERQYWDDYQQAYADVLSRCSTKQVPWYIVPADRKWFRNVAVAEVVVEALRPLKEHWLAKLEQQSKTALAELATMRSRQT
ncbi:MAG: polyphosphate kinase 2 family protein [Chloroflexaceae bacterium]|nr:polyphosphate kinase 2 family protein [Chloroflexaceae bacterium]